MQENLIAVMRLLIVYSVMTVTGTFALILRMLSFGALTNVCRRYIVGGSSQLILRLIGVRLEVPLRSAFPCRQVMYTFNHNSLLDVLLVTSLGLVNTRFFLSEVTLKFVPVTISALAIGVLYIPAPKHAERRDRFFKRTTERIIREGCSIFVSSEGIHPFIHGIAPFNDGVYHLAMEVSLPVVPLYFHIPERVNPLQGFKSDPGRIRIELLPIVDTERWEERTLSEHVASVRDIFVKRFNQAHGINE